MALSAAERYDTKAAEPPATPTGLMLRLLRCRLRRYDLYYVPLFDVAHADAAAAATPSGVDGAVAAPR